jgi:glycosyltransferase involved in cell wall biosynthesis
MPDFIPHNPLEGERPEMVLKLHNESSQEQIAIIVVHKDRPEYLNICLQSIAIATLNTNYEIIVVDNGSGQDTQNFLDDIQGEVKVIRNKENLYWAGAANKGAEAASPNAKYLVFMHSDVVVLNPGWLDLLINVSQSQNSGLVGLELGSYFMPPQKVDFVQEWCVLTTRECWKDAGPFEAEKLPQIGSPFIYSVRATRKGYRPQVMKNSLVHHYRIFGIDINEHERFTENAMVRIPQILRQIQGQSRNAF